MSKPNDADKGLIEKPESESGALYQTPSKPEWPCGLQLSKREKLGCYLPDDLKVMLTKDSFEQLFGYAYATTSEISCLGSVRRTGNLFVVERFYLVKQEGGSASTEMDPAAIGELVEQLLREGKVEEARSIKCWAHSHPAMSVFWSKTDDDTCAGLAGDYLVSLVVSDHFAIRCRIDAQRPIPFAVDNVPVVCELQPDQERLGLYAKEVAEKVNERTIFSLGASSGQSDALRGLPDDSWPGLYDRGTGLFEDEDTHVSRDFSQDPEYLL